MLFWQVTGRPQTVFLLRMISLLRPVSLVLMMSLFAGCAVETQTQKKSVTESNKTSESLGFKSEGLTQDDLYWLSTITDFYYADLQGVKLPYVSLVNELESWPAADYCSENQMSKIAQTLELNPSSVLGYDLVAYCAKLSGDTDAHNLAKDAITGISNVIFNSASGTSIDDPIQVKDAYEAQMLLRWAGVNVFDTELVHLKQRTLFKLHTRDQLTNTSGIIYADNTELFRQNLQSASQALYSERELASLLAESLIKVKSLPALYWQLQNQVFNDNTDFAISQLSKVERPSPLGTVLLSQALLNAGNMGELDKHLDQLIQFSEMGFVEASAMFGLVLLSSQDSQEIQDAINLYRVNIAAIGEKNATHSWLKAFLSQPASTNYLELFIKNLPEDLHNLWYQSLHDFNDFHARVTIEIQTKLAKSLMFLSDRGFEDARLDYANLMLNGQWGQQRNQQQGLSIVKELAQSGFAKAQLAYGVFYSFGRYGLDKDFGQSYNWYIKAAEQGNASALYNLGLAYRYERGVKKDLSKSIEYFTQALAKDFWLAACRLGDLYNNEPQVKDAIRSESYYQKVILNTDANQASRAECAYSLGSMLFYQQKEFSRGIELFELSADLGDKDAFFELGIIYSGSEAIPANPDLSVKYYEKAVKAGNYRAAANLGYKYEVGEGVPLDRKKALNYYRHAASGDSATGKNNYATFLRFGTETQKDVELAKKYYLESFEMGNDYAANNLGDMYYFGEFGERDFETACNYYEAAVKLGFTDALYDVGYCYLYGEGQKLDVEKGISFMNQAYKFKSADAAFSLGVLYYEGAKVTKDTVLSTVYFEQSAKWGSIKGMLKTAVAYLNGVGTRPDLDKARVWLEKAANLGSKEAQEAIDKIDEARGK